MCRTAASADGICNKATALMYFFLSHVNTAILFQKSDSFCVPPTAAFTGSRTLSVFLFLPLLPVSASSSIQPLKGYYLLPACHTRTKALHTQTMWVPPQYLAESPFSGSTLAFLLCFTQIRGPLDWPTGKMQTRIMQCHNPVLQACMAFTSQIPSEESRSLKSEKKESDYVLLSIREEITP